MPARTVATGPTLAPTKADLQLWRSRGALVAGALALAETRLECMPQSEETVGLFETVALAHADLERLLLAMGAILDAVPTHGPVSVTLQAQGVLAPRG
jgi:hypothetical protein